MDYRSIDIVSVCRTYPRLDGLSAPIIPRSNIIDAIDMMFDKDIHAVVVEGNEGIGKTTLLAQYSMSRAQSAISLFIHATSRVGYDLEYLILDLCNQMNFAIYGKELSDTSRATADLVRSQIFKLQQMAGMRGAPFYLIVDGFDDIPPDGAYVKQAIIELLPTGLPGFKVLLSGDYDSIVASLAQKVKHKPYQLPGFTPDETLQYLAGIQQGESALTEIKKLCRGIPSYLSAVRRILSSQLDITAVLDGTASELQDLFEIEWQAVGDNEVRKKILSLLAHDRNPHTTVDVSRILGLDGDIVTKLTATLSFLDIDPHTLDVAFVSETFRRFAAQKLSDSRGEVLNRLIEDLSLAPQSDQALAMLPVYFEQAGRLEDVLRYLSPEMLTIAIQQSESVAPVQQKAAMGLRAAVVLKRDSELMRFSLQKSAIADAAAAGVWNSEVRARLALRDYDGALSLAQRTVLKEDRLHLLAVIARAKRKQGLYPDKEIEEQIQQLHDQIDWHAVGKRAFSIATDLIAVSPQLAISIIERLSTRENENPDLDWTLARLSVEAMLGNLEQGASGTAEALRSYIRDPGAQRFAAEARLLFGDYTADEVLAQVTAVENPSDKLYMLRLWTRVNRRSTDAFKVVDFALRLVITAPVYRPNAGVLRQLASPLPYLDNVEHLRHLISLFDTLMETVQEQGPKDEHIKLQLLIAAAETRVNPEAARNRLVDVYFIHINELADVVAKAECLAELAVTVNLSTPPLLGDRDRQSIIDDLDSCVDILLQGTAYQNTVMGDVITTMLKVLPEKSLAWARALNTEERRDAALSQLLDETLESSRFDLEFVNSVATLLVDPGTRDDALRKIVRSLRRRPGEAPGRAEACLSLLPSVKAIKDPLIKCRALCEAICLLGDDISRHSEEVAACIKALELSWNCIGDLWDKVEMGFELAEMLAGADLSEAGVYMRRADECRSQIDMDASRSAEVYIWCMQLCIRAYSGLLPGNHDTDADFETLTALIDAIPSVESRLRLWTDLALKLQVCKRGDACQNIVETHIRPLITGVTHDDPLRQASMIATAAPALFCAHQNTAIDDILSIPDAYRSEACRSICHFLLKRIPTGEAYDIDADFDRGLKYREVYDICTVLEHLDDDSELYEVIRLVADGVDIGRKQRMLTRQEQAEIARRLSHLIEEKLPSSRGIQHAGFKIAATAQVYRVLRHDDRDFEPLIQQALEIPNLSDKVYTLGLLSSALPSGSPRRRSILRTAMTTAEDIPSIVDKLERYDDLANIASRFDATLLKECLDSAMRSALQSRDPRVEKVESHLVGIAYRFDPNVANTLASMADNDQARSARLRKRIRSLKLRDDLEGQADDVFASIRTSPGGDQECAREAWYALGELNAGKPISTSLASKRVLMQFTADLPLVKSYPILALIIESTIRKHSGDKAAGAMLRSLFEGIVASSRLMHLLVTRSSQLARRPATSVLIGSITEPLLVRAYDRESFIKYISDWLKHSVREYLKICDPDFGPEDLGIMQLLNTLGISCQVQILTSRHRQDQGMMGNLQECYQQYWRNSITHDPPPPTYIAVVGVPPKGELPIQDRWWLTKGSGLRLGTSFHDLGMGRDSQISVLLKEEADLREQQVDQYFHPQTLSVMGKNLTWQGFLLGT